MYFATRSLAALQFVSRSASTFCRSASAAASASDSWPSRTVARRPRARTWPSGGPAAPRGRSCGSGSAVPRRSCRRPAGRCSGRCPGHRPSGTPRLPGPPPTDQHGSAERAREGQDQQTGSRQALHDGNLDGHPDVRTQCTEHRRLCHPGPGGNLTGFTVGPCCGPSWTGRPGIRRRGGRVGDPGGTGHCARCAPAGATRG